MAADEPCSTTSCKYVVASGPGGWRVLRDEVEQAAFPDADAATQFACGLARRQAGRGLTSLVVVESAVKELHCFTPEPSQRRPAPRLRLVNESDGLCLRLVRDGDGE